MQSESFRSNLHLYKWLHLEHSLNLLLSFPLIFDVQHAQTFGKMPTGSKSLIRSIFYFYFCFLPLQAIFAEGAGYTGTCIPDQILISLFQFVTRPQLGSGYQNRNEVPCWRVLDEDLLWDLKLARRERRSSEEDEARASQKTLSSQTQKRT